MKTTIHLSCLVGILLTIFSVLGGGCANSAEDNRVRDFTLVMKCGTDVSLRFNVSGHIDLRFRDLLSSQCAFDGRGAAMTIQCPGNGLNWTHSRTERIRKLTAPNPYSSPVTRAEEHNSSGSGR